MRSFAMFVRKGRSMLVDRRSIDVDDMSRSAVLEYAGIEVARERIFDNDKQDIFNRKEASSDVQHGKVIATQFVIHSIAVGCACIRLSRDVRTRVRPKADLTSRKRAAKTSGEQLISSGIANLGDA
jgi:hypothetical protein